jgi:hypothetical protein
MLCLPEELVNNFVKGLKDGTIDVAKLADMPSSEARREFFAKVVGEENAKWVNALFESKLLLKNQQQGMINWIKKVAGLTPEVKRDMIAKVSRMTEILNADTKKSFYADLIEHKLGTAVTMEQASRIVELSKNFSNKQAKMESSPRRTDPMKATDSEMEYGMSVVAMDNYINLAKIIAEGKTTLTEKMKAYAKDPIKFVGDTMAVAKAVKSSLDDSFIGRQGIKELFVSPKTWATTFVKSLKIIIDTFGNKPVMDELRALIISDPDYALIKKAGVATASIEEAYPTTAPGKIPVLGKFFTASENAFTGSAHLMRYLEVKRVFDIARKTGVDLNNVTELKAIGKLVNSLTARGGAAGKQPGWVNNVIWSPKMIKANLDVLSLHYLSDRGANFSSFARKQAGLNLLKIVGGMAAILAMAEALRPGSVEKDPRNSDFGKIKIGNTRFDISGGLGSFITLATRLAPLLVGQKGYTKSSSTGKLTQLNKSTFTTSGMDVLNNFLENKTSPAASVIIDMLNGQNRQFKTKPNLTNEAVNLFAPMPATNLYELLNTPDSANVLLGVLADSIGISTNTYKSK